MFSRCLISLGLWLIAMPVAALPFRICAEPDNLPMSQQSTHSGFEIEVAALLAKDMGRLLEVVWVNQRDPSFYRSTIGAGACDALMSVPADMGKLTMTRPWYRSGYAFVTRDAGPASFDDPILMTAAIAVPATGLGETPPAVALTRRQLGENLRPYSIYEPKSLMQAVADRQVDLAVVWGPFAGWYADQEGVPLTITATPDRDGPTPLAFDLSIGVRKGNDALAALLDHALDHQKAAIAAVLMRYHVPLRER